MVVVDSTYPAVEGIRHVNLSTPVGEVGNHDRSTFLKFLPLPFVVSVLVCLLVQCTCKFMLFFLSVVSLYVKRPA
jgi:hypothetical protein